jgi:hypothetical protein
MLPRRHTPLAAALALVFAAPAALAQTASPPLSAHRIVIDSATGRPRMPDHEEFAAMTQSAAAQRSATGATAARGAAPQFSAHPVLQRMQGQAVATKLGATGRRVGAEKLSFSVVRRAADGKIEAQCVAGEDAASHALHADAKGAGHAQ